MDYGEELEEDDQDVQDDDEDDKENEEDDDDDEAGDDGDDEEEGEEEEVVVFTEEHEDDDELDSSRKDEYIKDLMTDDVTTGRKTTRKYKRNRAPFVKSDPTTCSNPQPFTIGELKQKFSASWRYVFRARRQGYAKIVEDMLQRLTDALPFGVRLHRRVGAGARQHKSDGNPGFVAKTGIAFYKMTNIVRNDKGLIVCFDGVGLDGRLTKPGCGTR